MIKLPDDWASYAQGHLALRLLEQVRGKQKRTEFIRCLIGSSVDLLAIEVSRKGGRVPIVKSLPNMTWRIRNLYYVYLSTAGGEAEQVYADLFRTSSVIVIAPEDRTEEISQSLKKRMGDARPTVWSLEWLISWRITVTSINCSWPESVGEFELYSYFNRRVIDSGASRSLLIDLTPIEDTMTDQFAKAERSRIMAAVKSKDTTPEMVVRRMVHGMGYRYRLHVAALPGAPDIVLPRLRKVVIVNGCFWHLHRCAHCRVPSSRKNYWTKKLEGNTARDKRNLAALRRAGWKVLVVWECQTQAKGLDILRAKISAFLASP